MTESVRSHFSLAEIHGCLADPARVTVARSTAGQMIAAHFGWEYARATGFAKEVVRGLTAEDFFRRTWMGDGTPADEYGVVKDGVSWYVKVFVIGDPGRLMVASCHLPQWDIPTPAGIVTCTQRGLRKP